MQQNNDPENVRKLLEQHWLHCRHLESERAWFMSVYAVITGGVLAFMAQRGSETLGGLQILWPLYFLIVLTFFGFFHTTRWTYAFECHRKRVNSFARIIWSNSEIDPTMEIPPMEIPLPKKLAKVKGVFKTRYWFPAFYFVVLVLFAFLFPPLRWWAIGSLAIALWLGVGFLRSMLKLK